MKQKYSCCDLLILAAAARWSLAVLQWIWSSGKIIVKAAQMQDSAGLRCHVFWGIGHKCHILAQQ